MNGNDNQNVLNWRGITIPTDEPSPELAEDLAFETYPDDVDGYYFVHFSGPVTREMKEQVINAGAELHNYVPDYAYIVHMNQEVKAQVEALPFVDWVGIYQPAYRVAPALSDSLSGEESQAMEPRHPSTFELEEPEIDAAPQITLTVQAFLSEDLAQIENAITEIGGTILFSHTGDLFHKLRVNIDPEHVNDLARIHGILWVQEYIPPELYNDVSRGIMNVAPVWETHGLTGANQIVGISDTSLDSGIDDQTMHPDFQGRIVNLYPIGQVFPDLDGHGTHVSGSVVGDGTSSQGQFRGIAPDARLVFHSLERCSKSSGCNLNGLNNYPDLGDLFQEAYDDGARIHSNSWGADSHGVYTPEAEEVDNFVWKQPFMLVLYASGNSGADNNQDNTVDTGSVGSPATAKNVLTVGASENNRPQIPNTYRWYNGPAINQDRIANNPGGMAAFSSRGPTDDGRIKPDVVAPGTAIISTRSRHAGNVIHFEDDMESGAAGWNADNPWGRVSGNAHSGSWCWHSNPGDNYQPNANVSLTSVPINISGGGLHNKTLQFWVRFDLPDAADFWFAEVSHDGVNWAGFEYSGPQNDWELYSIGLGPYSFQPALRIRFRLQSDADDVTGQGLFVDDVRIVEGAFTTALLSDFNIAPANSPLDTNYLLMNGTSMSTPLTAGAAALVRQYYTDVLAVTPSAALMRATLINGALEMSPGQYGPGVEMGDKPNSHEGWGRLDLASSIFPPQPKRLDFVDERPGLETEDYREYYLNVVDETDLLSVTMVYHDYPGHSLTNKLHMKIIPPWGGQDLFPNGLTGPDNDNNVQQIQLPEPPLGMYTIRIDAENVPQGPQPFALTTLAGGTLFDWPQIAVLPKHIDFGNVGVGSWARETIEIRNTGEQPLEISELALTGADLELDVDYHDPYDPSQRCGSETPVIPAKGRCKVRVSYIPRSATSTSGHIKIESNDPYHPLTWVSLTGTSLPIGESNIKVCHETVDFGEHKIGSTVKPRLCSIDNIGTAVLEAAIAPIASLDFFMNFAGPISPCNSAQVELNPRTSCTFTIHFTPEHLGVHRGEIEIHSNDPDDPVTVIELVGYGVH